MLVVNGSLGIWKKWNMNKSKIKAKNARRNKRMQKRKLKKNVKQKIKIARKYKM